MRQGTDPGCDRAAHFDRLQQALEEGLRAIVQARDEREAELARQRARTRLEDLNRLYHDTFADSLETTP